MHDPFEDERLKIKASKVSTYYPGAYRRWLDPERNAIHLELIDAAASRCTNYYYLTSSPVELLCMQLETVPFGEDLGRRQRTNRQVGIRQ